MRLQRRLESIATIGVTGEIEDLGPVMPYYSAGQKVYINIRGLCHGSLGVWDTFTHKWWRSSYKVSNDSGASRQTSTKWTSISGSGFHYTWRDDRDGVEVPGSMPSRALMVTVEMHLGTEYSAHPVASKSIIVPYSIAPPTPECDALTPCPTGWQCVDGQCVPMGDGDTCSSDADCPSGFKCVGGVCTPIGAAFPWEWVVIGGGVGLGLILLGSREVRKLRLK